MRLKRNRYDRPLRKRSLAAHGSMKKEVKGFKESKPCKLNSIKKE